MSSEGAYGIGAAGLVAGASLLAVAIGTAIKAKDTTHPPQERFVVSTRRKVVCGRYKPVSDAQVTFVVPKHMRHVTTTDKKGRALIPLVPEKLGSMSAKAVEDGALLVKGHEVPVNLTASAQYKKAVRIMKARRLQVIALKQQEAARKRRIQEQQFIQELRSQGARLLKTAKVLYSSKPTLVYKLPLTSRPSHIRIPQWMRLKVIAKAKGFWGYARDNATAPYQFRQLVGWVPHNKLISSRRYQALIKKRKRLEAAKERQRQKLMRKLCRRIGKQYNCRLIFRLIRKGYSVKGSIALVYKLHRMIFETSNGGRYPHWRYKALQWTLGCFHGHNRSLKYVAIIKSLEKGATDRNLSVLIPCARRYGYPLLVFKAHFGLMIHQAEALFKLY